MCCLLGMFVPLYNVHNVIISRALSKDMLRDVSCLQMRAAEFESTISEGKIRIPDSLQGVLPDKAVRVIVLWPEEDGEEVAWQKAALAVLREGDGPYDALYDNL